MRIYQETSENVGDDMEERTVDNQNLKNYTSKIKSLDISRDSAGNTKLNQSEAEELREELARMREENKSIINQFKDMQSKYNQDLEKRSDQSSYNEIKYLNAKLGGDGNKFELESDVRSNFEPNFGAIERITRESDARPLSDFGDTKSAMGHSERHAYRKRQYFQ